MAVFLHGSNVLTVSQGAVTIAEVPSNIIALIGISDSGPLQTLTLVSSTADAEQFGDAVQGNTIALALKAIQSQGQGRVIVVNIYDVGDHVTSVAGEAVTAADGKIKTLRPIKAITTVTTDPVGTTYVEGTDYALEDYELTILPGSDISNGDDLLITYDYLDETQVTPAQIAGSATAPRTGLELLDDAFDALGFDPKIIIAPFFANSVQKANVDAILVKCDKFRAVTICDSNPGDTPALAIADRGITTEAFSLNSKRLFLSYPHMKQLSFIDRTLTVPYSSFIAGVMAKVDVDKGFWFSPSNKTMSGVVEPETTITMSLDDSTSENQQLNAAGITTFFSSFGTGLRTWGNHSAAFPTVTTADNFLSVQRTADILHSSVILAMLQFIDEPITTGLIDAIRQSVNSFMRTLIGQGALLDGSECLFLAANNPQTEIAAGRLVFDIKFMPPTPAQTITFKSFIDISLLQNLFAAA